MISMMESLSDRLQSGGDRSLSEPSRLHDELNGSSKPLNFATAPEENDFHCSKKPKIPRDPMSHRIIEKRRRDRMNNCLADLSRLIPSSYMKQGQGRIEKTEIIEMAIRHIRQLKAKIEVQEVSSPPDMGNSMLQKPCCLEKFYMGFKECEAELMRFLVENEGWDAKDQLCSRLMKQLDEASKKFNGSAGNFEQGLKKESDYYQQPSMFTSDDTSGSERYHSGTSISQYDSEFADMVSLKSTSTDTYNIMRDKHLRTLLSKNSQSSSAEDESGIGMSNSSSVSRDALMERNTSPSNGFFGNSSSPHLSEDGGSMCSGSRRVDHDNAAYKFKHNITMRFSQEKRKVGMESDSSSCNSSREGDDVVKVRRKMTKSKSLSPNSDSSLYPTSECSSNGNRSNDGNDPTSQSDLRRSHNKERSRMNGAALPGFLLHPMGTFYMPISLTPAQMSSLGMFPYPDSTSQHHILHPISIPVNFGSHFVSMRDINVQTSYAQHPDIFQGGHSNQQMESSGSKL